MSLVIRTASLVAALVLGPPALASSGPPNAEAVRAEAAPAEYSVEVEGATLKAGGAAAALVRIKAAAGYHWNKEYPAKATVTDGSAGAVEVKTREFKQLAGGFEATDGEALVRIPVAGKSAGRETLTVETRFSVCNDKVCLIKKATAEIPIVVTN